MARQRIVIESPLKGDFETNRRYATWCCRYMHEAGLSPLASHLVAPWFMDDRVLADREAGIDMPWFWEPGVPHYFFIDLGESSGMRTAGVRCISLGVPVVKDMKLPEKYLKMHQAGYWPPHTPGFGPELSVRPHGWCNPDHPNFDEQTYQQGVVEQEAYDQSLLPADEARQTAALLEQLREVLKLPPKSKPPESR